MKGFGCSYIALVATILCLVCLSHLKQTNGQTLEGPYEGTCDDAPCENGGTCVNLLSNFYYCTCAPSYFGLNCRERTINASSSGVILRCGPTTFQVDIPHPLVASLVNASELYLTGDPVSSSCRGFDNGDFISLNSSLNRCGTQYTETQNFSLYRNTIRASDGDENTIIEYLDLEILVKCRYRRTEILRTHFEPIPEFIPLNELGVFVYDFAIFQDISYSQRYDVYPVVVSLNTPLFFRAELLNPPSNLEIHLRSCRVTPSPNYDDQTFLEFIEQGCGVNNVAVRVLTPLIPTEADFELTSFQFREDLRNGSNQVWVHCNVVLCDVNNASSECQAGCEEDRSRRSIRLPHQNAQRVVAGPLVLKGVGEDEGQVKQILEQSIPGKEEEDGTTNAILVTFSTAVLVAMVMMGMAVLSLTLRLREYRALRNTAGGKPA